MVALRALAHRHGRRRVLAAVGGGRLRRRHVDDAGLAGRRGDDAKLPLSQPFAGGDAMKPTKQAPAIRTTKTRRLLSRRAFLRGVGASAALLPMLVGDRAFAAGTGPKRLITIAWANGVAQPYFYPAADDPTANM